MLKNYLKTALRALNRNKSNAFINVIGLAVGVACTALILLFVQDELSYDRFHEKGERIFRVAGEYDQGGDVRTRAAITTYVMKSWFDTSFPDIQNTVRLDVRGSGVVRHGEQIISEKNLLYVDENFFDVFSFNLIHGDAATTLAEPNSMVMAKTLAEKYFSNSDPLGQTLEVNGVQVKITGVIEDMPANSHFRGDLILSIKTAEPSYANWILTNASGSSHYTYIELAEGVSPESIEHQLGEYLKSKDQEFAESRTYFLQPLRDIHLHSNLAAEIGANGDILYVYLLSAVAVIILFMACINYMNLAVARSAGRAAEVGLRKVVGASRGQLIFQFLGESVLTAFAALLFAAILIELSMPYFNELSGKTLQVDLLQNLPFLAGLTAFSLLIGLLAGSYPAAFLSAFQSINLLKGDSGGRKKLGLRKSLVLVQFIASVTLLTSTLLVYRQITFLQNKKLGFESELVVTIPLPTNEIAGRFEQFRTLLTSNPQIQLVSATNNTLPARISHWREYEIEGREETVMSPTIVVSHDFFETLQAEFLEGRAFDREFSTDANEAYIINESAAKFLGLETPVGTGLAGRIFDGASWGRKQARIIGVVRDFHLASLHTEIQPTVFSLSTEGTTPLTTMAVKISGAELPATLDFIENAWQKLAPEQPFVFDFIDENIAQFYNAEKRFLNVFLAFTGLAIFVTCLGVLGLSAYMAAQRRREIGVRKVLGASVSSIIAVLSGGFAKLMLLANILAWPAAWYAMNQWLDNFAYRVEASWWIFALAGGLALLIALLTVSTQAIRAATANPVESLRYE
mgnify:CR=1 FL=1